MTDLETALAEIATVLEQEGIPYMVIGGVATILWGNSRVTQDIDVTVWVEEDGLSSAVDRLARRLSPRVDDPEAFTRRTRVLPLQSSNRIPVDVVFGKLTFEENAIREAEEKNVGELKVRVCRVSDLIVHKVLSERSRDIEDVRFLITRYASELDRAALDAHVESLARELSRPGILAHYRACWPK